MVIFEELAHVKDEHFVNVVAKSAAGAIEIVKTNSVQAFTSGSFAKEEFIIFPTTTKQAVPFCTNGSSVYVLYF